jgi:hypothetical protein
VDYAVDLGRLARVYRLKGDLNGAERLYAQALESQRRVLPPSHPEIGLTVLALGEVLRARGRGAEAESLLVAYRIRR